MDISVYNASINKAAFNSIFNLVNGQAHNESLVAQLVRAPNRYLGGHGFDSRQGLRIFLCPVLVSLLKKIIFISIFNVQHQFK